MMMLCSRKQPAELVVELVWLSVFPSSGARESPDAAPSRHSHLVTQCLLGDRELVNLLSVKRTRMHQIFPFSDWSMLILSPPWLIWPVSVIAGNVYGCKVSEYLYNVCSSYLSSPLINI